MSPNLCKLGQGLDQQQNSQGEVEGLPQQSIIDEGSSAPVAVLPPILFITFPDDLLYGFSQDTLVRAYEDDLAMAVGGKHREETVRIVQEEVDKLDRRSEESGLPLKLDKYEMCLFTPSMAEFKWSPP